MNLSLRLVSAGLLVGSVACGGVEGGGFEGPDATPDLFGCVEAPDCVQDLGHLGEGLTDAAVRCGGELVASGEAGALVVTTQPGPDPMEYESLVWLVGDGTAYRQDRWRCQPGRRCSGSDEEWAFGELERCTRVDASEATGCEADGPCAWRGWVEECAPVEVFACWDVDG